jgi:hypothetical protein
MTYDYLDLVITVLVGFELGVNSGFIILWSFTRLFAGGFLALFYTNNVFEISGLITLLVVQMYMYGYMASALKKYAYASRITWTNIWN